MKREEAQRDMFDYVEMFFNPKRKHTRNGILSLVELERQRKLRTEGVQETQGYSDLPQAGSSVSSARAAAVGKRKSLNL